MCCAGTIHSLLPLDSAEVDRAAASGFTVMADHEGLPAAALPCRHLSGTACTIYQEWRPSGCDAYMCKLQKRMAAGDIDLEAAMAEVARLKEMIAQRLPEAANRPLRELVIEAAAITRSGSVPADKARMVIMVGAVNREIDRVIRYPFQGTFEP